MSLPSSFPKSERGECLSARLCLGRVFRSKRAEGQLQLRFIESVLWQIRSDILNESCHLFILQCVDQTADFARICRGTVFVRDGPVLSLAREHGLAFAR